MTELDHTSNVLAKAVVSPYRSLQKKLVKQRKCDKSIAHI